MKREKISVIIIVYNVEHYLKECVDSIRNQSYDNLEIILVDDGSTDESGNLCDGFSSQDDRIIVIHKNNGGLVSARQAGIEVATGKYTVFADGDDWIDTDMYEKLFQIMEHFDVDIVMSGIIREYANERVYDRSTGLEGFCNKEKLEKEIYSDMMYPIKKKTYFIDPSLCNKLFKTDVIKPFLLQVNKEIFYLGEDAAAIYPCLLSIESLYVTDFCMYHHRQLQQNKENNYKIEKAYERLLVFYEYLNESFKKTNYYSVMLPQLGGYFMKLLNAVTRNAINFDMEIFYQFLIGKTRKDMVEYRMPLAEVKCYKSIILYGAGKVGMQYYTQLKENNINVVLWIDKKSEMLKKSGLPVSNLEDIFNKKFEVIIIAAKRRDVADSMIEELSRRGISNEQIEWIRPIEK